MSRDDHAGGTICNDRQVIAPCSWGSGGALSPPVAPGQGPGGGPGGEAPGKLCKYCILQHQKWTKKQMLFYLLQAYFFLKFWLSLKKRENTREKY